MMILIAAPYRSGTNDDPEKIQANVHFMETFALPIFRKGHIPLLVNGWHFPWFPWPDPNRSEMGLSTRSFTRSPCDCWTNVTLFYGLAVPPPAPIKCWRPPDKKVQGSFTPWMKFQMHKP
jgi:hypothetical protein